MRTWIKNGRIIDGTGKPAFLGDLVLENGKIVAICKEAQVSADKIIDAQGLVVTPGFIDTHRHCDIAALVDEEFGQIELSQGITTVIAGNCGLAAAPVGKEYWKQIYDYIEPCLGVMSKNFKFETYSAYLDTLDEKNLPLHVGGYLGLGTIIAAVRGYGKSAVSSTQTDIISSYIKEGLEAGAFGISMGLMYQPECYLTEQELTNILSAATKFNRTLTCHIRGEGDHLLSSVREVIGIARKVELPLNISHFKCTGRDNWGTGVWTAIEEIEKARSSGMEVTVDFYPYSAGATTAVSLIPPIVLKETMVKSIEFLGTRAGREAMQREVYREHTGWENMVKGIGWERIIICSVGSERNRKYSGMSVRNAAEMAGYEDTSDFFCQLFSEEWGKVGIIVMSMDQQDVDAVAKLPYSMVISDSLYGGGDFPHPRLYGSFGKIIQDYVLKRQIFTLEEAVEKMTWLPAKRLGFKDRGLIKEGYHADLNIFLPNEIKAYADYTQPKQCCQGFRYVVVDGKIMCCEGKITGKAGRNILRARG